MRVIIDTPGGRDKAIARELIGVGARSVDLTPVMGNVLDQIRAANTRQFDSQGNYGSGGWAPLAASTVAQKQAAGLDPRILHATRNLRDSLTEKGHADQVAIARPDGLDFGTTDPKARLHQGGTERMPARPPVQFPESVRRAIPRAIQTFLITGDPARAASRGFA